MLFCKHNFFSKITIRLCRESCKLECRDIPEKKEKEKRERKWKRILQIGLGVQSKKIGCKNI